MPGTQDKCAGCEQLRRERESLLEQRSSLNQAHLAAVQKGDIGAARPFEVWAFEVAERLKQVESKTETHLRSHWPIARTASG